MRRSEPEWCRCPQRFRSARVQLALLVLKTTRNAWYSTSRCTNPYPHRCAGKSGWLPADTGRSRHWLERWWCQPAPVPAGYQRPHSDPNIQIKVRDAGADEGVAESAEGTLLDCMVSAIAVVADAPLAVGGGCGDIVIACFGAGVAPRDRRARSPPHCRYRSTWEPVAHLRMGDRATERHGGRASEGGAIGWRGNRYRWGSVGANGDCNALAARRPIAIGRSRGDRVIA